MKEKSLIKLNHKYLRLCILYDIRKGIDKKERRGNMKTWKLVAGILSIILSVFVFFQSVLVGTANTMSANGEVGGSAGVFVSIFMLAGGIVSIAVRNSQKNGFKYLGRMVFNKCCSSNYFNF